MSADVLLHGAANLDPEIGEMRELVLAAIEGEEVQKEIGRRLLVARERGPKSGPKAGGWADYLQKIGVTKTQAQDWMNLVRIGRRRRGEKKSSSSSKWMELKDHALRLSFCEQLKFEEFWRAHLEGLDRAKHVRECPVCNPELKAPNAKAA